jgi:hypothetical protein
MKIEFTVKLDGWLMKGSRAVGNCSYFLPYKAIDAQPKLESFDGTANFAYWRSAAEEIAGLSQVAHALQSDGLEGPLLGRSGARVLGRSDGFVAGSSHGIGR